MRITGNNHIREAAKMVEGGGMKEVIQIVIIIAMVAVTVLTGIILFAAMMWLMVW